MLKYKIDVLETLKENGYSTYKIRKQKILAESTLMYLRKGQMVDVKVLNKLCGILNLQPGDIISYEPDEADEQ